MNRNFDDEYREYSAQSTPDLWSRIESSLPEKRAVTSNETDKLNESYSSHESRRSHMWRRRILAFSGVAAACICLVISIPALSMLLDGGSKSESSSDMASDMASDMVSESAEDMAEDGYAGSAEYAETAPESAEEMYDYDTEESVTSDGVADMESASGMESNSLESAVPEELPGTLPDTLPDTLPGSLTDTLTGTIQTGDRITLSDGVQYISCSFVEEGSSDGTSATRNILVSVESMTAAGLIGDADNGAGSSMEDFKVQLMLRESQVTGETAQYDVMDIETR